MAIELKQNVKQSQQLMMSPQVQQAIKILALGRLELEEFIVEELRENPCLEESEDSSDEEQIPVTDAMPESAQDVSVESDERDIEDLLPLLKSNSNSQTESSRQEGSDTPIYELIQTGSETLYEDLSRQIQMMTLEDEEYDHVMLLLQYLDDNGFISTDLLDIAAEYEISKRDLEKALEVLQRCEPTGVGARNVQECLLLQLKTKSKVPPLVETILKDHWVEFEKQDWNKIAKALKADMDAIRTSATFVRENLDPKPARQFGGMPNQIIIPDVFVFKRDGQWVVSLNEDGLPRLKVSKRYASLLKDMGKGGDAKAKDFINTKIKSASWIVNAIQERNRTILRVAEVILKRQMEFFEKGKEYLRPLTLKHVAEELELHESTISRTTMNKYMHTPRGIFELKFFFNAGMSSTDGEALANEVIKSWVAEYIKAEQPGNALSDQDIANIIEKEKNMKVARRTIAKYREALGILPSSKRQKIF